MMKNKTYLMNFKEKEENVIYKNKNSNSIEELEAEFEPATYSLNSNRNIKPVIKIKNIEIKKNLFNKSKTININNFTNHKNYYSPDYNKYKRKSNLIVENRNNTIQNDNINFDRRSLQFNIKRMQTFNNNIFSPIKTQTTQIKRNPKVNQTETKLNIKYPSLGLGNLSLLESGTFFVSLCSTFGICLFLSFLTLVVILMLNPLLYFRFIKLHFDWIC